jgi:ribosomal silencing factor RsfS
MIAARAVILRGCSLRIRPHFTTTTVSLSLRLLSSSSSSGGNNDSNSEDWIPPTKPLAGDTAGSHKYTHVAEATELKQLERELIELEKSEANDDQQQLQEQQQQPDWLQTRRSVLISKSSSYIDTTAADRGDGLTKLDLDDIPVKKHTLLSAKELSLCIKVLGGYNVQLVLDVPKRMGGRPLGIIVVTAEHFTQRRSIADGIIYQLRRRSLQEVGVVGAEQGVDGNVDDPNETWIVVDCHSIVVHILDGKTRDAVNLEALWSGDDDMYRIDLTNEDALDDYVAHNPVPDHFYNTSLLPGGGSTNSSWDDTLKQLQTSQWVAQSRPKQQPWAGRRPPPPKRKKASAAVPRIKRR